MDYKILFIIGPVIGAGSGTPISNLKSGPKDGGLTPTPQFYCKIITFPGYRVIS